MSITNKRLKRRIIDISYKRKLSHLGSCLTAVDIIAYVYQKKMRREDVFVLSQGHAALALYVVLEKYRDQSAEHLFSKHGVHPNRDLGDHIHCSSGSLGHGLGIALGMALASPQKNVFCLISDGECAEGSIWEALYLKTKLGVRNLHVLVNVNGSGAYDMIDTEGLHRRIQAFTDSISGVEFWHTGVKDYPFLGGVDAHYHTMSDKDHALAKDILK